MKLDNEVKKSTKDRVLCWLATSSNNISIQVSKIKPILAPSYIPYPDRCEKEQVSYALKAYRVEQMQRDE